MSLTEPLSHPAMDDDGDSAANGIESRISLNHSKHSHAHGHGHSHGHHGRGAEVAAAVSYESYSFHPDATAVAAGVSLHSLNTAPDSHAAALLQLHIAKQYIARAQVECRERAQRRPVLSSYGSDNGTEALLSPMRGPDSDVLEIDSSPDGTGAPNTGAPPEMSPDDYYKTPWWKLLLKRLPWLVVLLLLQSFGALILNQYDKLLEKHLVLNFFIPMMQGTSGNAGNQVRV